MIIKGSKLTKREKESKYSILKFQLMMARKLMENNLQINKQSYWWGIAILEIKTQIRELIK